MNRFQKYSVVALWGMISLFLQYAYAGLGETEGSIQKDSHAFSGRMLNALSKQTYQIHEIVSKRLHIKEYLSNSGVVFGVTWSGAYHPDLTQLLGKYFSELEQATRSKIKVKGRFSHSAIHGPNLHVYKTGHIGAVRGKAFVVSLIPQGVSPNEIE